VLGSTLALAMGLVLLAAARLSGNPTANGLVVLVGLLIVATSCAMHLGAVIDRLFGSAALPWRLSTKVVAWLLISGGTAWLIGRAPRLDVLLALLLVPSTVGIAGVAVARDNRWPAVAYLVVAGFLMALVVWVWLD
jgi:putative effector of murein hydrolase LrgA (UPF0299 family)